MEDCVDLRPRFEFVGIRSVFFARIACHLPSFFGIPNRGLRGWSGILHAHRFIMTNRFVSLSINLSVACPQRHPISSSKFIVRMIDT